MNTPYIKFHTRRYVLCLILHRSSNAYRLGTPGYPNGKERPESPEETQNSTLNDSLKYLPKGPSKFHVIPVWRRTFY